MKSRSKKVQEVPVPQLEVESDDAFDLMMSALDWHFHVSTCREHTREERVHAFRAARDAFAAFCGDSDFEQAANAPTSEAVH